jgi:hypothetical protein
MSVKNNIMKPIENIVMYISLYMILNYRTILKWSDLKFKDWYFGH